MSREVIPVGFEKEERVLRRSKRNKENSVKVGSDTETGSESEILKSWGIGELSDNNKTVVEQEDSETETSVFSFGTLSNTAFHNETFEDRTVHKVTSFEGVVSGGRMSREGREGDGRSKTADSGLGRTPEPAMSDFMRWLAEEQKRSREESIVREERLAEEQRKDREDARAQMELQRLMVERLMARTADTDTPPPTPNVRLPTLQEGGDVEAFISNFETMLKVAEVPQRLWKRELITHVPMEAVTQVGELAGEADSTYEEVLCALRGSVALSFGSAAEDFFSGEKGTVWDLNIRSNVSRLKYLVKAIAGDSESIDDVAERMAIAASRDHLTPALRVIIDTGMHFTYKAYINACEQWGKAQPRGTSYFKRPRPNNTGFGKPGSAVPLSGRKPSAGPVLKVRQ